VRPAVRREHVLDGQFKQRTQSLDDLLSAGTLLCSHRSLISSPLPKSTSVSPAMTVRLDSIQSTKSFGFCPGNASTPTSSRSPVQRS
jgi:hypothetical protein